MRSLIQSARQRIATVANSTTTLLFWHLGRRLLAENLQDARAEYGKQILASVSRELTVEFGPAFNLRSLYRAIQFRQCFPDLPIVSTLSTQLNWSHFIELLPIETPLARDFYAEMCRVEHWNVRTLRLKIGGMLFERTALSKKPKTVAAGEIAKLRDGQMEFYLRWLDKHERASGEEAPIGLILCASAEVEQVELLKLDDKSIRVSEYLTELPPLPLLRARLNHAIAHSREHATQGLPAPGEAARPAHTTKTNLQGAARSLQGDADRERAQLGGRP